MTADTRTITVEQLAFAYHKARASNDAPEYDMEVARQKADRIFAALPAGPSEADRLLAALVTTLLASVQPYRDTEGEQISKVIGRVEIDELTAAARAYLARKGLA